VRTATDLKAALGLAIGGVPAVLIAAYLREVAAAECGEVAGRYRVVFYTAVTLLRAAAGGLDARAAPPVPAYRLAFRPNRSGARSASGASPPGARRKPIRDVTQRSAAFAALLLCPQLSVVHGVSRRGSARTCA
jgi:hypothetical protein